MSAAEHTPLVSVLLPVHNAGAYLAASIESILKQSFRDFELIIINDGSTDESPKIISSFPDTRIVLVNNGKNLGLIASLNKGIRLAKGKYIARMDADDIALPERFRKQVGKMESDPGIAVLSSFVDFINEDGEITGEWNTDREAVSEKEIRSLMMKTNCIAHPTVMMRTDIAKEFLYKQNQKGAEDWDLWMRILADGKRIAKIPEVLLQYRVHPASIMGKEKSATSLEKRLMRVKRKFLFGQLAKFRINAFYFGVKYSWCRNFARLLVSTVFPVWGRNIKRLLTSPPWKVVKQGKIFKAVLQEFTGRHFFIFPYTHVGGAEKVHAAIVAAVADQHPLVIFSNFSDNDKFTGLFREHAAVLDIAHYLHYPFTKKKAAAMLSAAINASHHGVLLGSNSGFFYNLVPLLEKDVKVIDLIHAFKYSPGGNTDHLKLVPLASRLDQRVFVSGDAMKEFSDFLFHANIPNRLRNRLVKIINGVPADNTPVKSFEKSAGVLFVGRNSPEKRLEVFLGVAHNMPPDFHFSVVGVDGPQDRSRVFFHGELTDEQKKNSIYHENDFLLVTSSREGFPMVIMEAMMAGLVVIATPVGDIPNHLDGKNGLVTLSADAENVVAEMKALLLELANDPVRVMKIKQAARSYALQNFSMEQFNASYRNLLLS